MSEYQTDLPERFQAQEDEMFDYGLYRENKGFEKGEQSGAEKRTLSDLGKLVTNLKLSFEQALKALDIPSNEWERYRQMYNAELASQS